MHTMKHICPVSQMPEHAQISNYQVKLDFTTAIIDRLLLVPRQQPWKIIPGEGTDTDTDTGTGTITDTII